MKPWFFKGALFSFVFALSTAALDACSVLSSTHPAPHMPAPAQESGMTLDWGHDVKTQALQLINRSKSYCYLDIYELSDLDVLHALEAARKRGVDVRVVVDATEKHSQGVAVPELTKTGVPVESLNIPRGISHIKMLVSDGKVLIGGMNYGAQSWNNNDASVYLSQGNPSFLALFRWDWRRASGSPAAAPGYERPLLDDRAAETPIVAAISQATSGVYMEAFDLSDYAVVNALVAACQRNITVEVLLDPSQYPNRRAATKLRDAGATVRFYQPYEGELMHAKILDVDKGRVFVIGSANFSHQAYTYNHEGDIELYSVPAFSKSLLDDLSIQISRGTDYPATQNNKGW